MAGESNELLDLIKDGWFEEIQQMWKGTRTRMRLCVCFRGAGNA